jgi:malate dehydrogenase
MREVAIIGAGELGGMVAHVLARRHAADLIRLVDDRRTAAEGKALDIMQAAPLEHSAATVVGASDVSTAAGAGVIVFADVMGGGEWQGDAGLRRLEQLNVVAPRALFVCAGATQRELVERGARELHLPRTRIVGSAAHALAAAATALVALELDAAPSDVALAVLGVPPAHTVIAWDDASVGGFALTRTMTELARRQIERRLQALWPVGPYALASSAALVVEALSGRSRRLLTCFVAPDNSDGARARTAAMPVRLGPSGVVDVRLPELSVAERVALDNAMLL